VLEGKSLRLQAELGFVEEKVISKDFWTDLQMDIYTSNDILYFRCQI
jgi:hypothetical protein